MGMGPLGIIEAPAASPSLWDHAAWAGQAPITWAWGPCSGTLRSLLHGRKGLLRFGTTDGPMGASEAPAAWAWGLRLGIRPPPHGHGRLLRFGFTEAPPMASFALGPPRPPPHEHGRLSALRGPPSKGPRRMGMGASPRPPAACGGGLEAPAAWAMGPLRFQTEAPAAWAWAPPSLWRPVFHFGTTEAPAAWAGAPLRLGIIGASWFHRGPRSMGAGASFTLVSGPRRRPSPLRNHRAWAWGASFTLVSPRPLMGRGGLLLRNHRGPRAASFTLVSWAWRPPSLLHFGFRGPHPPWDHRGPRSMWHGASFRFGCMGVGASFALVRLGIIEAPEAPRMGVRALWARLGIEGRMGGPSPPKAPAAAEEDSPRPIAAGASPIFALVSSRPPMGMGASFALPPFMGARPRMGMGASSLITRPPRIGGGLLP